MPTEKLEIPLGARVRYTAAYDRVERDLVRGHDWERIELTGPSEGVFIGYRYKQNGSWEYEYDGYSSWGSSSGSSYWCEDSRVKVALIVDSVWSEPRTVDPDSIEILTFAAEPTR